MANIIIKCYTPCLLNTNKFDRRSWCLSVPIFFFVGIYCRSVFTDCFAKPVSRFFRTFIFFSTFVSNIKKKLNFYSDSFVFCPLPPIYFPCTVYHYKNYLNLTTTLHLYSIFLQMFLHFFLSFLSTLYWPQSCEAIDVSSMHDK